MLDVVIATGNRHKARELAGLLRTPGIRWRSLGDFPGLPLPAERGRTFEANAAAKARAVARRTGRLALADDSGLCVDALGGGPGIRSARFAGSHGDDAANNQELLRRLQGVPVRGRRAHYYCALALASPKHLLVVVHGSWRGRIARAPRGRGGFGYDPIFMVPRHGKTVGELSLALKQQLSHRAAAARRLRPLLRALARGAEGTARRPTRRGSRAGSGAGSPGQG